MSETITADLERSCPSYVNGVILVLLAGLFWSSMGLGIRLIEQANL